MYPLNIKEEELKAKIARDVFSGFDCTQIVNNIDFCVAPKSLDSYTQLLFSQSFLWAEAKKGNKADIIESFVQLILTIGRAKLHANNAILPPKYLGAFDCEKIAFLPYFEIQSIFSQNDFNWNVQPSNHDTKEFKQLYTLTKEILESHFLFYYQRDKQELQSFIKTNFINIDSVAKIQIDKNNFLNIYLKWIDEVKPSISIDWDMAKQYGIIDADFYLADILSKDNLTLIDKLFVILKHNRYEFNKKMNLMGTMTTDNADFNDNQKAHKAFWNIYERPPQEAYWDYIIDRRDLLVPQDIREYKGSFYTPRIWVEKSQEYLTQTLGQNYQDEYIIWDCAAGTGNLLNGLVNARNIYASTLDKADVDIMQERARNGANLLEGNIFQFDFLNDCFFDKPCNKHQSGFDSKCEICQKSKLPQSLQEILKDKSKLKKLIIYINPPYAEASSGTTPAGTGQNKSGVATMNRIYEKYKDSMGNASNELFAQFFFRVYKELQGCILASFSTLKYINSTNFIKFREVFQAQFLGGFICPAYTFDNVKGQFPIGFVVWNLDINSPIIRKRKRVIMLGGKVSTKALDIYNDENIYCGKKRFRNTLDKRKSINKWIKHYDNKKAKNIIGYMENPTPDFQNNHFLCIINNHGTRHNNYLAFSTQNIIQGCIYFAVRYNIKHTWTNHNDQFFTPNKKWLQDSEFQNDCLAFTLFHHKNRITSKEGINHFIPFSEKEVNAKEVMKSDFMARFIKGKCKIDSIENRESNKRTTDIEQELTDMLDSSFIPTQPLNFSKEAKAVFEAAKKLFIYYHTQDSKAFSRESPYNPNVSLYDIKEFFQGRDNKGKLNAPQQCKDEYYKECLADLNYMLDVLANKITPKIYEYEFLE